MKWGSPPHKNKVFKESDEMGRILEGKKKDCGKKTEKQQLQNRTGNRKLRLVNFFFTRLRINQGWPLPLSMSNVAVGPHESVLRQKRKKKKEETFVLGR